MRKIIIFLDFDGVLCDSVKEAYLLSRYAFYGISPFEKINEEIYEEFKKYRLDITDSWQYYNFFTKRKEKFNLTTKLFNEKFLTKRNELILNHKDFWLSLETKTAFVDKIKPFINTNPDSFRILSTKNKEAILEKLLSWDIYLSPYHIYAKKDLNNISKGEFIKKYMNNNQEFTNAILIDDNKENIKSCNNFNNIEAILTSWGYTRDLQKGKTEDFIIKKIKENL